jgi:hypothetical protein
VNWNLSLKGYHLFRGIPNAQASLAPRFNFPPGLPEEAIAPLLACTLAFALNIRPKVFRALHDFITLKDYMVPHGSQYGPTILSSSNLPSFLMSVGLGQLTRPLTLMAAYRFGRLQGAQPVEAQPFEDVSQRGRQDANFRGGRLVCQGEI